MEDKLCVVCGRVFDSTLAYCDDCRHHCLEIFRNLPKSKQDVLCSEELSDAAYSMYHECGVENITHVIADYVFLIAVGAKTEADLRGVLAKDGKLNPDRSYALAHQIMTLYS